MNDPFKPNKNYIIVANAGTGKTTQLVSYYFQLLKAGFSPGGIAAFTFTEKAANELRKRITAHFQEHPHFSTLEKETFERFRQEIGSSPIGTLHQFCLRIIQEAQSPNLPHPLRIIDQASEAFGLSSQLNTVLSLRLESRNAETIQLLKTFGIRKLKFLLREYIRHLESPSSIETLDLPPLETEEAALLKALKSLAEEVFAQWKHIKQSQGLLSFADMEHEALQLIQQPPVALEKRLSTLTHLLIDEFQDTSPLQISVVHALELYFQKMRQPLHVFCVGDPKQSIYRFRKVDRGMIEAAERRILADGGEKRSSTVNFRSDPKLIEFVNLFSKSAFPTAEPSTAFCNSISNAEVRLIPIEPAGERPSANDFRKVEAEWVAEKIDEFIQSGHSPGNIAVLFRASTGAAFLTSALEKKEIAFSMRGGQELLERPEIEDMILLLRFLADPSQNLPFVGLLRSPLFCISDATLFFIFNEFSKPGIFGYLEKNDWEIRLPHVLQTEAEKLRFALVTLRRFLNRSIQWNPSLLLWEFFRELDAAALYAKSYQDETCYLALEQFAAWVQKIEEENAGLNLPKLVQIMDHASKWNIHKPPLGNLIEDRHRVQLLTFHAAKGLEFETVFIVDLMRQTPNESSSLQNMGSFFALSIPNREGKNQPTPRYAAIEELHKKEIEEENKRLLYVALTRAKLRLYISFNTKQKFSSNGKDLQNLLRSHLGEHWESFQKESRHSFDQARIGETSSSKTRPTLQWNSIQGGRDLISTRTVTELETFLFCPLKHDYLYMQGIPDSTWEESSPLSSAEMGTLLHAGLRIHQRAPEISYHHLAKRLTQHLPPFHRDTTAAELEKILENYLNGPLGESLNGQRQDLSEWPFVLKFPHGFLRGQIDRLLGGERWRLLDFKYMRNRASSSDLQKSYDFQMKTYALAAQKFLKVIPIVEIHLLQSGEIVDFHYSEEDLAFHEKDLDEILKKMLNPHLETVKPHTSCHSCSFHKALNFCPIPSHMNSS